MAMLAVPPPLACPPAHLYRRRGAAGRPPSTSGNSPRPPSRVAPNVLATTPAATRTGCPEEEVRRAASCLPRAVAASATASPALGGLSRSRLAPRRSTFRQAFSSPSAMSPAYGGCLLDRSNPTTTNSSRLRHFVFSQVLRPGSYGPLTRFETMPSSPCSQASRWNAGPCPIWVVGELERGRRIGQQRRNPILALDQRQCAQIVTVEEQ
jgi:hypothetical protein